MPLDNVLVKTQVAQEKCEAIIAGGSRQCVYTKEAGSTFCILHGGKNNLDKIQVNNYRLQKYRNRVNELANSDSIKSLREEIGILRMVMEEIVNRCKDTNDLLLYSSKITDTAMKIERLVTTCHKLESSLGFLMDKTAVLNISTQIVNIISHHVQDTTTLDAIVEEITTSLVE